MEISLASPPGRAQRAVTAASPQRLRATVSQTPSHTSSPADSVELDNCGGNMRTYTAKLLIERMLGVAAQSTSQSSPTTQTAAQPTTQAADQTTSQTPALPNLKAGDHVSLGALQTQSIQIVHASVESVSFSAEVDGAQVDIQATHISVDVLRIDSVSPKQQDPLVLDLAGDGVNLRPVEDGVRFDINSDGSAEQTGFVQGDDALLVWDRDADGQVTGTDLMGDQHGAHNGFEELRQYDDNADGRITSADSVWRGLRAYRELNGDGLAQTGELQTMEQAGVAEIGLDYQSVNETSGGQRITEAGTFVRADGTTGRAVDALLKYQEVAP